MNTSTKSLVERDQHCMWHPYTPLVSDLPLPIVRAKEEYLYTEDGKPIVDLISSWWVNLHGHNHPAIAKAVREQVETLDHVIFAGFTHPRAVELAERLLTHLPGEQCRIFFSDNGSTAVEVAIKMAIQHSANSIGNRSSIVVLAGAYHGDTVGAMSVSERGVFTKAFGNLLFDVIVLPRPQSDSTGFLEQAEKLSRDPTIAAFLYEPLVQGAGGMHFYDEGLLDQALQLFQKRDIVCIADEVMTGFGRTGKWFASDYLKNKPDIVCLSKGITGGVLPLGVTSCNRRIERAFMSDDRSRTFFHGHSYTGNPISCAAACASLTLLEDERTWQSIARIENLHRQAVDIITRHPNAENVRVRGTLLALNVKVPESGYLNPIAPQLYKYFLAKGLLIRPLGDVIYLMPPYCVSDANLHLAYQAIIDALGELVS